jgi:fructose-bisphosphate aldolase class I
MKVNGMNQEQAQRMQHGLGFIAALDQSGGSTPKALADYGLARDQYPNEEEMFSLIHAMRTRIISNPSFTSAHILGAILFEQTMDRMVGSLPTGDYLWQVKGIVPFLKVDKGLADPAEGVQLMKPFADGLVALLNKAVSRHMFGTKMRSMIRGANPEGIRRVVEQQFEYGAQILATGLVPIIEPEVDIQSPDKAESERFLRQEIIHQLDMLPEGRTVMLKLSIPSQDDFYTDLIGHPRVLRVVALSGGYSRDEANRRLARNHGLVASFSRALLEGLNTHQTDAEFDEKLKISIEQIYQASMT